MAAAREVRASPPAEDGALELIDVPATVVCVLCGDADCIGCSESEDKTASGVVVFVPWERPIGGVVSRLWVTTRASTQGAEAFFGSLPDGPVQPAFTFALVAEGIAVASSVIACAVVGLGAFAVVFPDWAMAVANNADARATLLRALVASWMSFTAVLVMAHALHGLTLHLAARHAGAKGELRRAMRFGLYAAGWDVATSPLGLLIALFSGGPRAVLETRRYAFTTPARATSAMLRGLYELPEDAILKARSRAMLVTFPVTLVAIVAAMALIYVAA